MLPLLRRAPAARILNVSSGVGSLTWTGRTDGQLADLISVPYPTSKSAVNMITLRYAKELRDTPIKVNAANPGYWAIDLNLHNGFLTAAQGASVAAHLATLGPDGPTGILWATCGRRGSGRSPKPASAGHPPMPEPGGLSGWGGDPDRPARASRTAPRLAATGQPNGGSSE